MAILLDRSGDDKELQEWMKTVKEFYGITGEKGDAKAVRMLIKWFAIDFPEQEKSNDGIFNMFQDVQMKYDELTNGLKTVFSHVKEK